MKIDWCKILMWIPNTLLVFLGIAFIYLAGCVVGKLSGITPFQATVCVLVVGTLCVTVIMALLP
jgi:hypothetical protein